MSVFPLPCPATSLELTQEQLKVWADNVAATRAARPDLWRLGDVAILLSLGLPQHMADQAAQFIADGGADEEEPACSTV